MGRYAELQKAWDENREEFRRLKEEMEKMRMPSLKLIRNGSNGTGTNQRQ